MGMYRIEWDCCGSVTETDGYAPSQCPICELDDLLRQSADLRRERDELRTQVHIITSERDELADCVQSSRAKHAELAARLAEIEAQEPTAWDCEYRSGERFLSYAKDPMSDPDCMAAFPLIARPAPAAAPDRAAYLDADIIEAQRAVVQQLASRPVCNWVGQCRHQRQATADAPVLAEPAERPCRCGPRGER